MRDGVAEAQMAFALRAEYRAGNGGDVRLLEQNLRGGAAVLVDFLHVGKCIERAGGRLALQPNLIQSRRPADRGACDIPRERGDLRLRRGEGLIIAYCTGVATPLVE